jgi:hypothetical protein
MNGWIWRSFLFGWLGVGGLGCAPRVADHDRLLDELAKSRQQALTSELRLVALDRRLSELERDRAQAAAAADSVAQAQILARLDLLVAQNERLLQLSTVAPQLDPEPAQVLEEAVVLPAVACGDELDPQEQLRRSVERLRQDPSRWRGGLSPAQNQAVNVLLRRRRTLDLHNPWDS